MFTSKTGVSKRVSNARLWIWFIHLHETERILQNNYAINSVAPHYRIDHHQMIWSVRRDAFDRSFVPYAHEKTLSCDSITITGLKGSPLTQYGLVVPCLFYLLNCSVVNNHCANITYTICILQINIVRMHHAIPSTDVHYSCIHESGHVAFTWGQFHRWCTIYVCFEIYELKI